MRLSLIILIFSFSPYALAQTTSFIPEECKEETLKKEPNGEARLQVARSAHGTGKVDPAVHPKANEHAISQSDLEKEIVYYDPIKKNCGFTKMGDTPFGTWVKGELAWRKQQKLSPPDVTYHPVEIDAAYTASYWRTLTLTSQASLFDRRAANGMRGTIDAANYCSSNNMLSAESSSQLMKEYAEQFTKFYHANLNDYLQQAP